MLISRFARVLAVAAPLIATSAANAAPTTTAIGTVSVLGNTYSVSLLYDSAADENAQSFNALSPNITFTTPADALLAAEALRDTFGASFDWHPASSANGVRIPFSFDVTNYQYVTVTDCCGAPSVFGPFSYGRDDSNGFSFAQFTSAVPEPETYAMLLAGLGVLGFVGKRRKAG